MITIRILYASKVYYGINFWGIVILFALTYCVLRGLSELKNNKEPSKMSVAITIFAVVMLVFNVICACNGIHPYSKSKMRYECLLEDGSALESVPSNYKVVEQRGDIIILEDR